MKALKIIIAILLFAILIVGAWLLYNNLSAKVDMGGLAPQTQESVPGETRDPKSQAPDFTFYDYDGNAMRLSDFEGKPVVLNFWASWCGPCKMEMPDFQAKFEEYGEEIQFLMMNRTDGYQETVDSATSFIEKEGYTFPVFYDKDNEGARAYGVSGVPITYFIDADGYVEAYYPGAMSGEILQSGLDILLGLAE